MRAIVDENRLIDAVGLQISPAELRQWESKGWFPRRRALEDGRVGWLLSEIAEWQRSLPLARLGEELH